MKNLIISVILVCVFAAFIFAAPNHLTFVKPDSAKTSSLSQLLNLYYNIKDALANSDASSAASSADKFVKAMKNIDIKNLSEAEHNAFMPVMDKLNSNAKNISENKDLAQQRIHFASLSDNFYSLAKEVKISSEPIYRDYCPMKKKYWLSGQSTIKNPYYGKAMPTCGEVKETLK